MLTYDLYLKNLVKIGGKKRKIKLSLKLSSYTVEITKKYRRWYLQRQDIKSEKKQES